ncbi:hypothetical protein A0H81_05391 [Grifola frondosa]|uniref:Uncharacterized protein n=1 Tax=Grifola frondosa TaxID=5627 RepID=A0A1C7MHD7_GRIFR|nr:hypothetical protein A0H81_05391 [Grifola frondosa]
MNSMTWGIYLGPLRSVLNFHLIEERQRRQVCLVRNNLSLARKAPAGTSNLCPSDSILIKRVLPEIAPPKRALDGVVLLDHIRGFTTDESPREGQRDGKPSACIPFASPSKTSAQGRILDFWFVRCPHGVEGTDDMSYVESPPRYLAQRLRLGCETIKDWRRCWSRAELINSTPSQFLHSAHWLIAF